VAVGFSDPFVINYFNYFTEVEQFYQTKRKSFTLLSTLDWVLVESWKESGVPLEIVLKGIDRAFSHAKREITSLAYCVGPVAQVLKEEKEGRLEPPKLPEISADETSKYLNDLATKVEAVGGVFPDFGSKFSAIAATVRSVDVTQFQQAEQELSALEEKVIALLKIASEDSALVLIKQSVDAAQTLFLATMTTDQLAMLEQQLWRRKLMEKHNVPRLSLFYLI